MQLVRLFFCEINVLHPKRVKSFLSYERSTKKLKVQNVFNTMP